MIFTKTVLGCAIVCFNIFESPLIRLPRLSISASRSMKSQLGNSISGIVFGVQRQPVSDVDVELLDEFSRYLSRVKTTSSGRYSFNNIRAGRYKVKVMPLATGYEEQIQEYEIINFSTQTSTGVRTSGSDSAQIDFFLRPRRASKENFSLETVFAQDIPGQAKKLYKKAVSALENNSKQEGIVFLNQAIAIFPDYYLALEKLGLEHIKSKNYEEARKVLIKTVSVNVRSFNGWYNLAECNYVLKDYIAASDSAKKAIELSPNSINAFLLHSISLKEKGDYAEAEAQLLKANEISKGVMAEIHWQLAKLYGDKLKRFGSAADELEIYLKLDPKNPNDVNIKKLIAVFREKARIKVK